VTFAPRARIRQPRSLEKPPGSNRLYVLPILLALLALAGWYSWPAAAKPPTSLSGYEATGSRNELNCLRLVIGVDVSGSMRDFTVPRDDALQELFSWLKKKNLRSDDQVAIIDFAAVAEVRMPPTQVADLGSLPAPAGAKDGTYTYFRPILRDIDNFPRTTCDTALVLISDAQLADLPATEDAGRQLLLAHHVGRIRLLVPGAGIYVPPVWKKGFPSAAPLVFDGTDAEATGLAFGHIVVGLTGQSLTPVRGRP
jgi:hypothetical protein